MYSLLTELTRCLALLENYVSLIDLYNIVFTVLNTAIPYNGVVPAADL
jgi:hypothetical protein